MTTKKASMLIQVAAFPDKIQPCSNNYQEIDMPSLKVFSAN